mgnify:CR=1 FL=1
MKMILLGPPGCGKGTHGKRISSRYDIPIISTGDIIRVAVSSGSALGEQVKGYMASGNLVPDDIVIALVKDRLTQDDCKNGFIFDGFPRTVPQAEAIDAMGICVDMVLSIELPDQVIVNRVTSRRVCPSCSAGYDVNDNPSRDGVTCDMCGATLIQREDDKAEIVENRLKVYHEKTAPLVAYYEEQGLLHPHRSETGYRLYSIDDICNLNVIRALRELDMPLSEIRAYLDRRSPGELVELLERRVVRWRGES